jgi:hypothetical protein
VRLRLKLGAERGGQDASSVSRKHEKFVVQHKKFVVRPSGGSSYVAMLVSPPKRYELPPEGRTTNSLIGVDV